MKRIDVFREYVHAAFARLCLAICRMKVNQHSAVLLARVKRRLAVGERDGKPKHIAIERDAFLKITHDEDGGKGFEVGFGPSLDHFSKFITSSTNILIPTASAASVKSKRSLWIDG